MEHGAQLEVLLFVSGKPLQFKALAKILALSHNQLQELVIHLKKKYNTNSSGIHIVEQGEHIQMVTHPDAHELVEQFVKKELTGELTRPQLETLAIIAYRGPIAKPHIEEIRGVNCSLIVRNLLIRGLIEEKITDEEFPAYAVTVDFMRFLGIKQPSDLPNYKTLNGSLNNHGSPSNQL